MKTYSELIQFKTFEERFQYLKLDGVVGEDTFGLVRYLNQRFYSSAEWRRLRNSLIIRDNGCDLGVEGYEINGNVYVHHINPLTKEDIFNRTSRLCDPENLIITTFDTHNAIHYGDDNLLPKAVAERTANDTCPWRR